MRISGMFKKVQGRKTLELRLQNKYNFHYMRVEKLMSSKLNWLRSKGRC